MSKPIDPLYSPLLGIVLPRHAPTGPDADTVRAIYEAQRPANAQPGALRVVQLTKGGCGFVLHPSDVINGMTRLPEFRPRKKRGRK